MIADREILPAIMRADLLCARLEGPELRESSKTLGQLRGLFKDAAAYRALNPEQVIYRVQWWEPVPSSTESGLFWGLTTIEPGRVGDEYFMTHGHFHTKRDRAEYYGTIAGSGTLILMNQERETRAEAMCPGSLHYIPGATAHRVANTGQSALSFWACWPSDAGHDYATIDAQGFSGRMRDRGGLPTLVSEA